MSNPRDYYFSLPPDARPPFVQLAEQLHPDYDWLTRNRSRSRGRDVIEAVDTVVIHATAGYATQHAVDTWRRRKASAHWIVPDENEPQHGHFVWATVAAAKAAFHVGAVDYVPHLGPGVNVNNRSLGIEIVNTQDVEQYTDTYSAWQILATARIVLHAWAKYPNLRHVISHARLDPSRRGDPGRNFPWDAFRQQVLTHAAQGPVDPLVHASYTPPARVELEGHCCSP